MGVTSVLTLHWSCLFIDGFRLWPHCRLFIFTPFSHGKWLSYSLSPAQTSSTQISLIASKHPEYTPWPFAKGLTFFLINDNPFVYMFALGPYNLLPLWHITMSLPQKDSCLDMLCLLWVSESTFSRPIARLTQYPLASRLTFRLRRIYLNTCHRFELKVTQDLIPLTTMHSHSMLTLPPSYLHHTDNQIVAHWNIASLIFKLHTAKDWITQFLSTYCSIVKTTSDYTIEDSLLLLARLLLMTKGEESVRGCNRFLMTIALTATAKNWSYIVWSLFNTCLFCVSS